MTNMTARRPSIRVNVAEAKAQLSALMKKALAGQDVIIAKDNKPLLKLVPIALPATRRRPGSAKGKVWMASDFDETPKDFADYL
jgi:prevent-host-death family protein